MGLGIRFRHERRALKIGERCAEEEAVVLRVSASGH
jgi:hypothetical protein